MAVHREEGRHSSKHRPPCKQGKVQAKNLGESPAECKGNQDLHPDYYTPSSDTI